MDSLSLWFGAISGGFIMWAVMATKVDKIKVILNRNKRTWTPLAAELVKAKNTIRKLRKELK